MYFALKKNATLTFRIPCRFFFLGRTINKIIILYLPNLEQTFYHTSVKFIECQNHMEIQTLIDRDTRKDTEFIKTSRVLFEFGQCNENHNQQKPGRYSKRIIRKVLLKFSKRQNLLIHSLHFETKKTVKPKRADYAFKRCPKKGAQQLPQSKDSVLLLSSVIRIKTPSFGCRQGMT